MKSLSLKDIIKKIEGETLQGDPNIIIKDFVTRFKRLKPEAMLFDIYHDRHENSEKIDFECAVITDRPETYAGFDENVTIVGVKDIDAACWKFIEFYRSLFKMPVVGVTGTCGKTTTKEMTKYILASKYNVNATYKSYNAQYRFLKYLLDIDDNTQAAVYEMGVASPGDLRIACRFFKPQIGVITNIGIDHLQAFGTHDAYIRAKAELADGIAKNGTLILNADDENIKKINLSKFKGEIKYFGFDKNADYVLSNVSYAPEGINYTLEYKNKKYDFYIHGFAEFNVYNAAAAIAATHALGVDIEEAGNRLASYKNIEKHFELNSGINGSTVIDDTWSTNPTSTEVAIKLLKNFSKNKKTIAVLGKMSLLGRQSGEYHYKAGESAAKTGIDQLVVIGDGARAIGYGALHRGMSDKNVFFCNDSDEAYQVLKKILDENSVALVKTSMMASYTDLMEKIIAK